jgi:tetratricopeptide (TPR) repeat protein
MTRVARRGLGTLVAGLAAGLLLLFAFAGPARADDAEKEARRLFQKAELSFNVGKFADALTDYQAAYQAKPLPGFLFNVAQCYRNMGDFERARFFFRRYLALEPRAPNKRRVEELIDEMTKQLEAKQAQGTATPPATTPPAPPPPPAETPPPSVTPIASAETPGATEPAAPPPAAAPEAKPDAPPMVSTTPEAAPEGRPIYTKWWFWTGVVVVLAGAGAAGYVLSRPETKDPGSLPPIDGR